MIDWINLAEGFSILFTWQIIISIFGGMLMGLIIGVIPGMTAALGLAVILPLTFKMDALPALVLGFIGRFCLEWALSLSAFWFTRRYGGLFLLGLILDVLFSKM